MIALLGALDEEITGLVSGLEEERHGDWKGFTFHRGLLDGKSVVIAKVGVGKSLAAMLTQKIIDEFLPECLILTGVAGAINPDLDIGDTVVARDCLQHDVDVTALGLKRGAIPFRSFRVFTCDERLVQFARSCEPSADAPGATDEARTPKVAVGRVLTGDTFLGRGMFESRRYLRDELSGDAVEMEGASMALTATVNELPFLIIRTISDRADGKAGVNFRRFMPWASRNSMRFVRHILRQM